MDINKLTASIQVHESLVLKVYDDANDNPVVEGYTLEGNPTIAYGRCLSTNGVSNAEATYLLGNDIQDAINACEGEPWWPVVSNDDVRSRALVEMCFNMGIGGLRTFTHALAALAEGDFDTAATDFLSPKWLAEVGDRARVLTEMIRTGQDPSPPASNSP